MGWLTTIPILVAVLQSLLEPSTCQTSPDSQDLIPLSSLTPVFSKAVPREHLPNAYCASGDPTPTQPSKNCTLCAGRCGSLKTTIHRHLIYCSCDVGCVAYGDCCEDFEDSCPEEFLESLPLQEHFKYRNTACFTVPTISESMKQNTVNNLIIADYHDYNFLSVCGQTGNICGKVDPTRLHEPNLAIPVIDSKTGLHYVNYDCARCNNVTHVLPWKPRLTCDSSNVDTDGQNGTFTIDSPEKLELYLPLCKVTYTIPTNATARRFCGESTAGGMTCPLTCNNTELVERCETSYMVGYLRAKETYPNYYCALCAGEIESSLTCAFIRHDEVLPGVRGPPGVKQFSLSLLFDFNPSEGVTVGRKACLMGQQWMASSQTCHQVACLADLRLIDNACLPLSHGITHSASMFFNLTRDLKTMIQQLEKDNITVIEHISMQLQPLLHKGDSLVLKLTVTEILDSNRLNVTLGTQLMFNKNSTFNLVSDLDSLSYNITSIFEDELVLLLHKSGINLGNVQISLDDNVAFTQALLTDCTWFAFFEQEYQIKNEILLVKLTQTYYTKDTYRLVGTKALVCILNKDKMDGINLDVSPALGMLTIILISLSIICLTIRIVLQFKIPYYRSFAGRLQFNLFLALCMAFLVLLLGGVVSMYNVKMLCAAFGTLMYWFFLAAFSWMAAVTFDTWLIFRPAASFVKANETSKSIIRYVVPCWLLPATIAVIVTALDFFTDMDSRFKPDFGTTICWFNQRYALLVYFGVPVALLTLTITIFFTMTIIHMRRTLRSTIKQPSEHRSHHVWIYFRLFALMGVSWIIGFIAAFVGHDALWIIFIILNASQGILVFISFVLNRQVLKELCYSGKTPAQFGTELTHSTAVSSSGSASQPYRDMKGKDIPITSI